MEWILFALLAAVFAALVAIFGKLGVADIDSTLATTVRAVVMAVFLIVVAFSLGKAKLLGTIDSRAFTFIFFSGIAGALSWLFYFFALKTGPAGAVAALDRLSVVFVLLLAALFLGDDHYKWRLTRANGAPERFVSGDASGYEKFLAYASALPLAEACMMIMLASGSRPASRAFCARVMRFLR